MVAGRKGGNATNGEKVNTGVNRDQRMLTRDSKKAIHMTKEDEDFIDDSEVHQTNGEPPSKKRKKFNNGTTRLVNRTRQNEQVQAEQMSMQLLNGPVSKRFIQSLLESNADMIDLDSSKQKLSGDNKDLNARIKDLEGQCRQLEGRNESIQRKLDDTEKQMASVNRTMKNSDDTTKAKDLQKNLELESIKKLKQHLATIGHDRDRITDDVFRQDMRKLAEAIHHWATKVGKEVKNVNVYNVAEALECVSEEQQSVIRQAIPSVERLKQPPKTNVVNAIVSAQVSKIFRNTKTVPAVLDSETAETFMERVLGTGTNPAHEDELIQWRALTRRHLYAKDDRKIQELTKELRENESEMLMNLVSSIFGTDFDAKFHTDLEALFFDVILISRRLLMQRGRYVVEFPNTSTYDPSIMDDKFGESDPEHAGKRFEFALFPALLKISDDYGQHITPPTTVSNARVFWSDPDSHSERRASESIPHPMSKKEEQKPESEDELGEGPAKDQHMVGNSEEHQSMQQEEYEQKQESDDQLGKRQQVVDLTEEDQTKEANQPEPISEPTGVTGGGTRIFEFSLASVSEPTRKS